MRRSALRSVIPAQAGIQDLGADVNPSFQGFAPAEDRALQLWMPAFAGMTTVGSSDLVDMGPAARRTKRAFVGRGR